MFYCPGCAHRQVRTEVQKDVIWTCENCGGRIASIGALRKLAVDVRTVEEVWKKARRRVPPERAVRACPACAKRMKQVSVASGVMPVVDVCNHCQLFWFDPGEFELIPKATPRVLESRETTMRHLLRDHQLSLHGVKEPNWQFPFLLFGLPVELTATRVRRHPLITWWTVGTITVISLIAFIDLKRAVELFAYVPAERWRLGGITVLTAFALHADPFHLAGNMYYLLIFGDNVEDFLGPWRYAALLLLATVIGGALHTLVDPTSSVPCIGASGGISGVLAFYALRFPKARVLLRVFYSSVRKPVWMLFLVWVGLQGIGVIQQVRGLSAVSAAAHIGGALVGVLFWAGEDVYNRFRTY